MENSIKISGVIITYNEKLNIERCILSLRDITDEIIVVDSFSTDSTRELASALGAKVISHTFEGHIEQKNFAMNQCQHDWILSLDADEAISNELKSSILKVKENTQSNAYSFNRRSNYCGKWIWHCGWYPDVKTRLFRKDAGAWGGRNPHDQFIIGKGQKTTHLSGDLLHYTFYTVEQHKKQIENFSTISAKSYFELGRKSNGFKVIFSPIAKFIRNYFLKGGILDGYYGLLICALSAKATYLKYVKLQKIQKGQKI